MNANSLRMFVVPGLLLCLLGSYLIWHSVQARTRQVTEQALTLPVATVIDDERPLPEFRLQRLGGSFTDANLLNRWSLLFFGYTHCPEVCPTELALLKNVNSRLQQQNAQSPQVIFVSVDQPRDSVELLGRFVREFDPAFIGATASDDGLAPLTRHLGVFFQRNDRRDSTNYTVDHTAAIYLIDPRGRLKAVFEPPQQVPEMARELASMIAR